MASDTLASYYRSLTAAQPHTIWVVGTAQSHVFPTRKRALKAACSIVTRSKRTVRVEVSCAGQLTGILAREV